MGPSDSHSPPPSQWLFPVSALQFTPSVATSAYTIGKELYDRARGVEFLFRLGSSLGLPSSAMFTAATWFHRFFMRFSMEDYHRQDVAASCVFLATKTEECGRKLRDVARICQSKITGIDIAHIPTDSLYLHLSQEVEQLQTAILLTEEVLLEAICFDFGTSSPHAELVDLFDAEQIGTRVQDYAWSIAHDSYRTPLCILFSPRVIATACYVLAQHIADGSHPASLDARISASPPSASLPTPPSHKPASPDASRFAIEYFSFSETELVNVAEALSILLEFYKAQDMQTTPHVARLMTVQPPKHPMRIKLYEPFSQVSQSTISHGVGHQTAHGRTPNSSDGGSTPVKTPLRTGAHPVGEAGRTVPDTQKKTGGRLDLS
ncbi:cyclin-like protein [Leucogyrophana mollusca]|uniref:Cyclin-like protein n=1 Tax=Leucogyrophana mollusca TaxID=85980 RepID=A0ACB8BZ53_9AGAM|nr:cyclin-like protein [Leucogyrophana mollusca]